LVSSGFNAPNPAPKIHLSLVASADKPSSLAKFLLLLLPKIGCFEPRQSFYGAQRLAASKVYYHSSAASQRFSAQRPGICFMPVAETPGKKRS